MSSRYAFKIFKKNYFSVDYSAFYVINTPESCLEQLLEIEILGS
jgi:hypothetical protein